jgi:hypothetical protein
MQYVHITVYRYVTVWKYDEDIFLSEKKKNCFHL